MSGKPRYDFSETFGLSWLACHGHTAMDILRHFMSGKPRHDFSETFGLSWAYSHG